MGAAACTERHGAPRASSGLAAGVVGAGTRAAWRSILYRVFAAVVCHQAFMVPAVQGADLGGSAASAGLSTTHLFTRFDALAAKGMTKLHRVTPDTQRGAVALYLTHVDTGSGNGDGHAKGLPVQGLVVLSAGGRELARLQPAALDHRLEMPAFAGAMVIPGGQTIHVALHRSGGVEALTTELVIPEGRVLVELQILARRNGGGAELSGTTWSAHADRSWLGRGLARIGLASGAENEKPLSALTSRPDFRAAQGQCQGGNQWEGLRQLETLRAEFPAPPEAYFEAVAHCAIGAGARPIAVDVLEAWQRDLGPTPRQLAATARLAELHFVRGYAQAALDLLEGLAYRRMRTIDAAQALDLHARILISLGQVETASELLIRGPHLRLAELWELDELDLRALDFLRINHGVTLLRSGRTDEGRALLDLVGSRATASTHGTALRDKANLMLAWNLLANDHGEEAAAVFNRVSLDGPFAEPALLGRGWAAATGPSERAVRAPIPGLQANNLSTSGIHSLHNIGAIGCTEVEQLLAEAVENCPNREYFEKSRAPEYAEDALKAAHAFWHELLKDADPRSVTAVEAVIAMADVHLAMGQREQARSFLNEAQVRIAGNQERLSQAQQVAGRPASVARYAQGIVAPAMLDADNVTQDMAYFLLGWGAENSNHELASTLHRLDRLSQALQLHRLHEARTQAGLLEEIDVVKAQISAEMGRRVLQQLEQLGRLFSDFEREVALKAARSHEPYLSEWRPPLR